MNRAKELSEILNKLFTNKKFMATLMADEEKFSIDALIRKMSKILCYYIATGYEDTNYPYPKIEKMYDKIAQSQLKGRYQENLIENGVMTHSFNGYQKEIIEKYGFDYSQKLSESEKVQKEKRRNALNALEKLFGESNYLQYQESKNSNEEQIFLTSPGEETFSYALKASPERLFAGPLKVYGDGNPVQEKKSIIIGEKKNTFFRKVLQDRMKTGIPDEMTKQYKEYAEEVAKTYCTLPPSFAMINLADIKDIPVSNKVYDEKQTSILKEYIDSKYLGRVKNFFSQSGYKAEDNELKDLATLRQFIPEDSFAIVDVMDAFELKQLYAKLKGAKIGQLIHYDTCENQGEASIQQLSSIIDDIEYNRDLDELNETYLVRKQNIQNQYLEKANVMQAQYQTADKQNLEEIKSHLREKEEAIFQREYVRKKGVPKGELKSFFENYLIPNDKMNELLKSDEEIVQDGLQYGSELHGVSHTRRVNFLLTALMNVVWMSERDQKMMRAIVKNHDIGRENDWEDSEHGEKSVQKLKENPERLEEFTEEEKELIEFVIKEHSKSFENNREALRKLPKEESSHKWDLLQRFKDVDKLDRVRLDPMGKNPREGLNVSRLYNASSRTLEGLAYEAYNKVLEILDIEKQIFEIEQFLKLEEERGQFEEFENRFRQRKEVVKSAGSYFLSEIVNDETIGISVMNAFLTRIKSLFQAKEKSVESEYKQ